MSPPKAEPHSLRSLAMTEKFPSGQRGGFRRNGVKSEDGVWKETNFYTFCLNFRQSSYPVFANASPHSISFLQRTCSLKVFSSIITFIPSRKRVPRRKVRCRVFSHFVEFFNSPLDRGVDSDGAGRSRKTGCGRRLIFTHFA